MRIFQSDDLVCFGEPLPVPLGKRPPDASFTMARARAGFAFCLRWKRTPGAIGYHVFRSMSVATIRDRSMKQLWMGQYSKEVRHFALAYPDVDVVVDDYGSRGASIMYYWVLAQISGGHLVEVDSLVVGTADTQILDGPHFALRPGGGFVADVELRTKAPPRAVGVREDPLYDVVGAPDADASVDDDDWSDAEDLGEPGAYEDVVVDAAPVPPPMTPRKSASAKPVAPAAARPRPRRLHFSRFVSPGGFAFLAPRGSVHHYSVYMGTELPDEVDQEAMWRDVVYDSNPMEQFRLPPRYTGFRDDMHPKKSISYAVVLAFMNDRRVVQVDIALSHNIETLAVLR